MTRTGVFVAAAALQFVVAGPAPAADPVVGYDEPPYCVGNEAISLVVEPRLMDEAVAVSHDQQWVYSGRPVFVWANEAKYSCGKAYGYLKASYRDEQTLNNCGCAYSRMQSFMH